MKKSNVDGDKKLYDLTSKEKIRLYKNLKQFRCKAKEVASFNEAQVCSGGVPLNEVNPKTMASTKVKGLYFTGELLDVDGVCGGYNLAFAWISGMLAGKGASESD